MNFGAASVRRRFAVMCVVALAVAACSGDDDSAATTLPSTTVPPSTTSESSVTTVPSATTDADLTDTTAGTSTTAGDTAPEPNATTSPPGEATTVPQPTAPTDFAAAVSTWQAAVTAAANGGDLGALTSDGAEEAFRAIEQFLDEPLVFHTFPSSNGDGTVAIAECVLVPGSESGALLFRSVVSADNTQVDALDFDDAFKGCVPTAVSQAALAGYAEYWDAFPDFMSPPNPDDPRLDETVTGSHRQLLADLLVSFRDAGREFRGEPGRDAYVVRFIGQGVVLIGDCQSIPADFGEYVAGTDQRTDGYPAPVVDQTDYRETTMEFVDGTWKVSQVAAELNSPCEDVGTSRAVTVVGSMP